MRCMTELSCHNDIKMSTDSDRAGLAGAQSEWLNSCLQQGRHEDQFLDKQIAKEQQDAHA